MGKCTSNRDEVYRSLKRSLVTTPANCSYTNGFTRRASQFAFRHRPISPRCCGQIIRTMDVAGERPPSLTSLQHSSPPLSASLMSRIAKSGFISARTRRASCPSCTGVTLNLCVLEKKLMSRERELGSPPRRICFFGIYASPPERENYSNRLFLH